MGEKLCFCKAGYCFEDSTKTCIPESEVCQGGDQSKVLRNGAECVCGNGNRGIFDMSANTCRGSDGQPCGSMVAVNSAITIGNMPPTSLSLALLCLWAMRALGT